MSFVCARMAALSAAVLATIVSHGVAQQSAATQPAVIRFPAGALFEVPQGWSWIELNLGRREQAVLSYDGTAVKDRPNDNPNRLVVTLSDSPPVHLDKDWTRADIDRSRTLSNGAAARWKIGEQWGRIIFAAAATMPSKSLAFTAIEGNIKFDRTALESAFLKIAGSMRKVPPSNAIFHPAAGFTVGREFKNWNATVLPASVGFRCGVCEADSRVWIYVYPAKKPFSDLSAALADVTGFFVKQDNAKAGEPRRASLTGGEILWTEQPGSTWPVAGVLARDGRMFYVNVTGRLPNSLTPEALRADYLAVVQTVRPWDGR